MSTNAACPRTSGSGSASASTSMPFFVCFISGSRLFVLFFVELGRQ
jgi:hypothetical protein